MLEVPKTWPDEVVRLVKAAVESNGRVSSTRSAVSAITSLSIEQQGQDFKLGICRTFTVETQLDSLNLALSTLPCRPKIMLGNLGNIEQILLDSNSQMLQAFPDALLVLWRLDELHPRLLFEYDGMSIVERESAITSIINRIKNLCTEYNGTAPLFLSTLPMLSHGRVMNDLYTSCSPKYAVLRINKVLHELTIQYPKIHLYDFSGWVSEIGASAIDFKMDLYAQQPIARASILSFAKNLSDTFRPLVRTAAKVLVLDLDKTLWGGVLGEDGVSGLKIGYDYPGNIYRRIQLHALSLKNRGILLVLLSKNNLADVEQAFSELPDMPLKLNDFSAIRINWQEKNKNIKEVSAELNLGLDSFVFVDDQVFEREQMRFNEPEVQVLDASKDPLETLSVLINCQLFDTHCLSNEDRNRSAEYKAQLQRGEFKSQINDPKKFLCTLKMQAKITLLTEATIPRAVQMLTKTNQFNLTTQRHTEVDLRRMLANKENVLLVLSLRDRFSDQGIVGLIIAIGDKTTKISRIDSFLLSCRVIGRGVEQAIWSSLVPHLSVKGFKTLHAEYFRTTKNSQVKNLFEDLGMVRQANCKDNYSKFTLDLPAYPEIPEWINIANSAKVLNRK